MRKKELKLKQKTSNLIRNFVGWFLTAQGIIPLIFLLSLKGSISGLVSEVITGKFDPDFWLIAAMTIPPSAFFIITGRNVLNKTDWAPKLIKIALVISVIESILQPLGGKPEYNIQFYFFSAFNGVSWYLVERLYREKNIP